MTKDISDILGSVAESTNFSISEVSMAMKNAAQGVCFQANDAMEQSSLGL